MSVETVTPTEVEQELGDALYYAAREATSLDDRVEARLAIRQALAEQRAEIVGRYEAVAAQIEDWSFTRLGWQQDAAARIRDIAR